jgi:hypothetical protein
MPTSHSNSFIIIIFLFKQILSEKVVQYSIASPLYDEILWNQLIAPLVIIEGYPMAPRPQKEAPWFWRSQCHKQNKQITFPS